MPEEKPDKNIQENTICTIRELIESYFQGDDCDTIFDRESCISMLEALVLACGEAVAMKTREQIKILCANNEISEICYGDFSDLPPDEKLLLDALIERIWRQAMEDISHQIDRMPTIALYEKLLKAKIDQHIKDCDEEMKAAGFATGCVDWPCGTRMELENQLTKLKEKNHA